MRRSTIGYALRRIIVIYFLDINSIGGEYLIASVGKNERYLGFFKR